MIELVFIRGGALRKVFVDRRKINLLSAELNFTPIEIDLDKISEKEMIKKKMSKEEIDTIKQLSKLGSEMEIVKDIKKDFQRTGWRLSRRIRNVSN